MELPASPAGIRLNSGSRWNPLVRTVLLFALSLAPAFGHDANEITTGIFLRTNSLEVRVTMAAQTAVLLMKADGSPVEALSDAAAVQRARPFLNAVAGELFQFSSSGHPLVAAETNVTLSVEDHIEMKLIYPRPGPGGLRVEAVHLKKLPSGEPYGAMLTAVDLANNAFLGQKLLTADNPAIDLKVTAPAPPVAAPVPASGPRSEAGRLRGI